MFDNPRYLSKGVNEKVSIFVQMLLWDMVDEINISKNYLQIFNLTPIDVNGVKVQKIVHTQEQPPYTRVVVLYKHFDRIRRAYFVI